MTEPSTTYRWLQMNDQQQMKVFIGFAIAFNLKELSERYLLIKAFREGEPDIIMGKQDGREFVRIAPEFVTRMELIFAAYGITKIKPAA